MFLFISSDITVSVYLKDNEPTCMHGPAPVIFSLFEVLRSLKLEREPYDSRRYYRAASLARDYLIIMSSSV